MRRFSIKGGARGKPVPPLQWQPPLARQTDARRRPILIAGGIGLALIALAASLDFAIRPAPRIIWNVSASAPIGLWRVHPGARVRSGDMVLAWMPDGVRQLAARRRYLPANVPLLKRVAARDGDEICALGRSLYVNGRPLAVRREVDRHGRPLPWWSGCIALRDNHLLLLMDAPDSFDGRYFGPIGEDAVIGRAVPLWLR